MPDFAEEIHVPFKQILVPLDGSSTAEEAVSHAIFIAESCGAQIHLLHVQTSHGDEHSPDSVDWRLRRAEMRSYLNQLEKRLSERTIPVTSNIVEGRPSEQIVEYSEENDIDLLIFTAYGKGGISRFHFGSTAHKVISGSGISFMIVRPGELPSGRADKAYKRILILMDGSHSSEWVACQVAAMVRGQEVELILLQVISVPEMPRRMPITQEEYALREKFVECNRRAAKAYLEDIARQLQNGIKVRVRLEVTQSVVENVCGVAMEEEVDLIAMDVHDTQGGTHWEKGNLCQAVMCRCSLPLLVFQDLPDTHPQHLHTGGEFCPISHFNHPSDRNVE
ncbi:universal stress protein [Microbulbifer rhizosphaerae]|uniref:universal stress protein n=1 Tax=Microbulbifer rhizosphaerae TaxID=1562603 RepID=UPI00161984E0|nr:universal stress protein [Microbulbifer rhizosphaerae]